jgi:ATP-dependent RNA helicase DDX55/SPB4
MTDADAMSELVRAGLRNPVRIIVKVQSKQPRTADSTIVGSGGVLNERRIPSRYALRRAASTRLFT